MKSARRARSPATEDSTTSEPCPCACSAPAHTSPAETAPCSWSGRPGRRPSAPPRPAPDRRGPRTPSAPRRCRPPRRPCRGRPRGRRSPARRSRRCAPRPRARAVRRRPRPGRGGAPGQPDPAGAQGDQPARGGQGDLGGAAEDEQGLRGAEGILHGKLLVRWGGILLEASRGRVAGAGGSQAGQSPSRRDRSERNAPAGSRPARSSRNSASRGYIAATVSGRIRESFARQTRPPAADTSSSTLVQEAGQTGQGRGQIQLQGPAGRGERHQARVRRPEPLEDSPHGRAPARRDPAHHPVQGLLLVVSDGEPVAHEPAPAVERAYVGEGVRGVEEGGDRAQLAGPRAGRAPVADLVAQGGGRGRRAEQPARQRRETGRRDHPGAAPEHFASRVRPCVRRAHIRGRVLPG